METKQEIGKKVAEGETQEALEVLRDMKGRIASSTMMEIDLLSSRYFTLQSNVRMNIISYEESNRELSKINSSILTILNEKILDDNQYGILANKYEEMILELGDNYKSISRESHVAVRIRKKYKVVKFIAEKLNEYPELIIKFINTEDQGVIGGIAYKVKMNPKVEDLSILKVITKNCKSRYSKGQIVNAIGEIIHTGELRFGDDVEIREILEHLNSNEDIPLNKNIERVITDLDHLLAIKK